VIRTRKTGAIPRDAYACNPGLDAWSIWFESKEEADEAVIEARAMSSATSEEAFDKIRAKEPVVKATARSSAMNEEVFDKILANEPEVAA
jgi:hypothetical protein